MSNNPIDTAKKYVDKAIAGYNFVSNSESNIDLVRNTKDRTIALGEKAVQSDFWVDLLGFEDMSGFLFRTMQMPAISRGEPIEDFAPFAQKTHQMGNLEQSGQVSGTIVELKSAAVRQRIKIMIYERRYTELRVRHAGEGYGPSGFGGGDVLEHVIMQADPVDFDTSAGSAVVTIPLTFTYSGIRPLS